MKILKNRFFTQNLDFQLLTKKSMLDVSSACPECPPTVVICFYIYINHFISLKVTSRDLGWFIYDVDQNFFFLCREVEIWILPEKIVQVSRGLILHQTLVLVVLRRFLPRR